MRGKGVGHLRIDALDGITPAYAGKRFSVLVRVHSRRDHPRVCGAKTIQHSFYPLMWGSPPRTRGKEEDAAAKRQAHGITPAYAGKSLRRAPQRPLYRDHPRVCGEKFAISSVPAVMLGSPPRMRGKAHTGGMWVHASRIPPAYAGKRSGWQAVQPRPRDHPRVCGEK